MRSSRGSFGWIGRRHATGAERKMTLARNVLEMAEEAFAAGNCRLAFTHAVSASRFIGAARAHARATVMAPEDMTALRDLDLRIDTLVQDISGRCVR